MVLGVAPSFVLDCDVDDLPIVDAVLKRANQLRVEYDEQLADAIAARTASRIVTPLARHITRLARALRTS